MKTIFVNATLVSMQTDEMIEHGALGIENENITYVGPTPEASDLLTYDEVVDVSGKLIVPGFVNTHGHAAMTLLRGFGDDLPLQEWLETKVWPMERRFQDNHVAAGVALALVEMVRSGTTCFLDMYDHMDAVANQVVQSGMRAVLCRGIIGFDPVEIKERKFQEAISFARNWHGESNNLITTMLAPHSAYTCTPDLIERFVEESIKLSLPLHTHMSETAREVEQNVTMYGKRPVEHLLSLGVFDQRCLVAHAVHLTSEEISILAEHDVKIAHNPRSNLKLGSGIAPIPEMLQKGLRPSLATDGASSNNRLDMLDEIQITALIHKGNQQDSRVIPAFQALQMGTLFGAEALFLEDRIGTLEIGKRADFLIIDTSSPHMQPPHSLISQLVYAASSEDIRDVYVDGKALMRNRELMVLDEEKIKYEANQAIQQLL